MHLAILRNDGYKKGFEKFETAEIISEILNNSERFIWNPLYSYLMEQPMGNDTIHWIRLLYIPLD